MASLRVWAFVDFWNLQLTLNEYVDPNSYRLDWKALSPRLVAAAEAILGQPLKLEGTNVYLSYNSRTTKGKGLHNWAINTLDRFPGIHVIAKERKPAYPPTCPSCHQTVHACPYCQGKMTGTVEKGIDAAIVTDMISLAWENVWDVAILVSSDHDFMPLVDYLTTKGRKIINAHFPPKGAELARACWASIDLRQHLSDLKRDTTGT